MLQRGIRQGNGGGIAGCGGHEGEMGVAFFVPEEEKGQSQQSDWCCPVLAESILSTGLTSFGCNSHHSTIQSFCIFLLFMSEGYINNVISLFIKDDQLLTPQNIHIHHNGFLKSTLDNFVNS